ncbi:ABC transporter permease, partial [Streptomyces torulosus]|uniref:ABC transporter permease n=1 Tax=Streptomyces torulosus TaxID=68276 RepID=UPI001F0AA481
GDSFVPQALIPFLVLLVIAVIALHATPFGRSLFAIGASEEAARFTGIRVKRQKLILFTVTGVMASLTGIFWALHYASARYDNATGLELSVIAAVLLGGIDFDGGKGTLGGAIAGVFLLGTLQNVMSLQDVSAQSQIVVTGVLLVLSVLGPRVARQISVARAGRGAAGPRDGDLACDPGAEHGEDEQDTGDDDLRLGGDVLQAHHVLEGAEEEHSGDRAAEGALAAVEVDAA